MHQLVGCIAIKNWLAGQGIVPSLMSQPNRSLCHPIWTGQCRCCTSWNGLAGQKQYTIWYGLARWDIIPSHKNWPVEFWTIPYGPAHLDVVPVKMDWLDEGSVPSQMDQPYKTLYQPIWAGQIQLSTIPYGPAGWDGVPVEMDWSDEGHIPSQMDWLNIMSYCLIWAGQENLCTIPYGLAGQNIVSAHMSQPDTT